MKTFFKPIVERFEDKITPAPLLAVTAAQVQQIHDIAGFDGEADLGQAVPLPAKVHGNASILLTAPGTLGLGQDHWLATVKDGVLVETFCNVTVQEASAIAAAHGVPMYELTEVPEDDGKLPVDPQLLQDLDGVEAGSVFRGVDLESYLQAKPTEIAAPGLTLQLAVPNATGFQVHTLTGVDGGNNWTLTGIEQVSTLIPQLGLWELKV